MGKPITRLNPTIESSIQKTFLVNATKLLLLLLLLLLALLLPACEEVKRIYLTWIKNAILKAERNDLIARQIMQAVIDLLKIDIFY